MSKRREIEVIGQALFPAYGAKEAHDTVALIHLKAHSHESEAGATRAPVDIIAVIDVSGSMAHKLPLVQETLLILLDQLKPEDRLAIVTFETHVQVLMALTELTKSGKDLALRTTNHLAIGGSTFLSGGLIQGLDLLSERATSARKNNVASILFLTDGQATDGITSQAQLVAIVRDYVTKIPDVFSVNTFGYGADHNPALLRKISDASNGMFYFIEKNDDILMAYADCLSGLLSMVAQKIFVEIEVAENVTIVALHTTYKFEELEKHKKFKISVPDLYGDEEKDAVCEIRFPALPQPQTVHVLASIKVSYRNLITKEPGQSVGLIFVSRPEKTDETQQKNLKVTQQTHRLEVAEALKCAEEHGQKNNLAAGQQALQTVIDKITNEPVQDTFSNELVVQLQTAQSALQSTSHYRNAGAHNLNSMWSAHASQRSNAQVPMYQQIQQQQMQQQMQQQQQQQRRQQQPPIQMSLPKPYHPSI